MSTKTEYFKKRLENTNARHENERKQKERRNKLAIAAGGLAILAVVTGNELNKMMDPKEPHTETVTTEKQYSPTSPTSETFSTPNEVPIPVVDLNQYEESFKVHIRGSIPNSANFYQPPSETE